MSDYYKKLQAQMDALKNNTKSGGDYNNRQSFSPKEGKTVVRILPNFKLGKEVRPFLMVQFYTEIGTTWKDPWLAPCQFDEPDAIADFRQKLLHEASQERDKVKNRQTWELSNKFRPQIRVCVPVLVRSFTPVATKDNPKPVTVDGLESEGVKFWWFYAKTMKDLETIMDDPDYGEIYDLKSGRDITITYTPKDKTANGFAVIDVLAKPNKTPVSDDAAVLEAIKNMPDVLELYTKPTYEQTVDGLKKYLSADEKKTEPETKNVPSKPQTNDEFLEELNSTNPVDPVKQATDEFDDLF